VNREFRDCPAPDFTPSRTWSTVRARALALLWSVALPAQGFEVAYGRAEGLRLAGTAPAAVVQQSYREALLAFAELPGDAPARRAALPAAAFCAEQAGELGRAAALAQESLQAGYRDDFHVELRIRTLACAGQAEATVVAVDEWSRSHPTAVVRALAQVAGEVSGALCEAADVLLRQGQTEAGLRTFAALAEAAQRQPLALANWALALHRVGRVDEAEARYREALTAAPSDADLWNDLGLLLKGQRRDAEAMVAFRRSFELDATPQKAGPAATNLVLMQRAGRTGGPAIDVVATLRGGLGRSPVSAMVRRLILDELRARASFPVARPDTGGSAR
jgi:tetratricopeptide (TPR) repeat protein